MPAKRSTTSPTTFRQYSLRRLCATASSRTTTCTMPLRLAQVEERDTSVIAPTRHPPGEGDGLADVLGAQGAGVMGADHWFSSILCLLR